MDGYHVNKRVTVIDHINLLNRKAMQFYDAHLPT